MYDVLKTHISTGGFKLSEVHRKIKKLYIWGDLTEEQADELLALSQQHASADAERPENLALIQMLLARVEALEKKSTTDGGSDAEQPEYEDWVQPVAGLTDKYQPGAIVKHKGQLWKSNHPTQNTWEPGAVGTELLWVRYEANAEKENV